MKRFFKISAFSVAMACVFLLSPAQTKAEVTVYTDEAEFLEAVAALDLEVTTEGFEDDAVWGESRITLADRVADRIEAWIHFAGVDHLHVLGQPAVDGLRQSIDRDARRGVEVCDLPVRVDPGVGTSRSLNFDGPLFNLRQSGFDFTLDRALVGLDLPAREAGPLVGDRELEVARQF